jgi:ferrochelatase
VIPFLRNVTRGRGIPDERLEEVAHHYRHFGGVSPINAQNRALKAALEAELARRGSTCRCTGATATGRRTCPEAVTAASEGGDTTLLAFATSAYSSFSSCRQYREDFARVLEETGLGETVTIDKIRPFTTPGSSTFVEGVRDAIAAFTADGAEAEAIQVLFTTHSVPTDDAALRSARRRLGPGRAYAAQHEAVAAWVMSRAGGACPPPRTCPGSSCTSRVPAPPRSRGSSPTSAM